MAGQTAFSFDIGTNSIGWAVLRLDAQGEPAGIIDAGVRIYSDGREPKSGTSLAEGRRVARGMARRRDRYKRRRRAVLNTLAEYGLMPDTAEARRALVAETNDRAPGVIATDVYALRARALDEKLPLHHLGRALFHLNQRRGFKSNRKTDTRDNDQGKIAAGISRLGAAIAAEGARTLGEFLHKRRRRGDWVRVRPDRVSVGGGKGEEGYGFYPERSCLRHEFEQIWAAQAAHYPDVLTEARREHLELVMFFQRPLRRPKVGKCSFNPDEERLPKAHPLFQEFRLLKEINELELVHRDQRHEKLTPEQRDALYSQLKSQRAAAFSALRKTIKAPFGTRFNKESEARDKLKGDEVAAEMNHKDRFGQDWFSKPIEERWAIIETLTAEDDPLVVRSWLEEHYPGFTSDRIDAIAEARLPPGYGRLGPTAIAALIDELRHGIVKDDAGRDVVLTERQAIERVWGDNPVVKAQVKNLAALPPYQEIVARRIPPGTDDPDDPYDLRKGRLTNPTIHIGLNQLRRVVNALVRRYGKPEQIAVELARDLKLSEAEKQDVQRTIGKNTRDAERRSAQLLELGHADNGYNRLLLKLWEELDLHQPLNRVCVYCGKPIGIDALFSEIDVDHILPWSRTLDDSQANRIVCHRECNRQKGNRAPAEVALWQDRYDEILERAERLPRNKRWRFARDAMKKFKDEESFLARQLTDTQYLSRMAHEYLGSLFPDEEPNEWGVFERRNHVRVIPGRMTEMLRRQWGLNTILSEDGSKNRNDHRHHAIDAAVIGVTTRSLLQRIAKAAGGREAAALEETIGKIDPPWPGFRDELKAVIDRIVVSHKPDHGTLPTKEHPGRTTGQLHEETAYGLTGEKRNGVPVVVYRVPFMSLDAKKIDLIRDERLAKLLRAAIGERSGTELTKALTAFRESGPYKGIRHVRITKVESVVEITDAAGKPYKGYAEGGNFRFDVWELPDGRWDADVVSVFRAHLGQGSPMLERYHNPRKIMSLAIGDMVAYDHPDTGRRIIARAKIRPAQQAALSRRA